MSLPQSHGVTRLNLDLHGLIFNMSICYRQDQPGWNQLVTVKQADQIIRGKSKG